MIRGRLHCFLLALCCAVPAAGAPALVTVQDTLYKADGSPFQGVAYIQWRTFEAGDRSAIPTQTVAVRITSGVLRVQLDATTTATPQAFYQVKYNSDGRTQFIEYWSVPPTSSVLRLRDVRIASPLLGGGAVSAPPVNTAVLIDDVAGLRGELDIRAVKGSGFLGSRAAVINGSGQLEGAMGDPADCVRVDGSAGPCGSVAESTITSFVDAEVPAGAVDGLNTSFALSQMPSPAASLSLYRNGLRLQAGSDFTVSGGNIVLGIAPVVSDRLQAFYRVLSSTVYVDGEVPSGNLNGTNASFSLQASPAPAASLQLYRNGLLMRSGVDYTLSGATITFANNAIPQAGDLLTASYRR